MPSKCTEVVSVWLRRTTAAVLAAIVLGTGWVHGVLYVEGRSMAPALYPGDAIVYRRIAVEPDQGDMVVFEHRGTLVVHRVAGVMTDGSLRTRGDANDALDVMPVSRAEVRGQVVWVVPVGRLIVRLAAFGD